MKKITLQFLCLLLFAYSQAQTLETEFTLTKDGANALVIKVDSLKAEEIYSRAKTYVQKTYKNPDKVIKVDEFGKLLRFEGDRYKDTGISSGGEYHFNCEIEFRDGRYKISFIDLYRYNGTKIYARDYFNSKGEVRHYDVYRTMVMNTIEVMNSVSDEIKNFIKTDTSSDW